MPELPEVEASRALIQRHCVGRAAQHVEALDDEKVFDGSSPAQVAAALQGRRLVAAGRKGKQLWLTLEGDGPNALMHFGMTGYVAIKDSDDKVHVLAYENAPQETAGAWPPRFHKLVVTFGPRQAAGSGSSSGSGSVQLAYCDARRFGRVKLVQGDPAEHESVRKLGFDPYTSMPDLQAFTELLSARAKGSTRLKPLLLDQGFAAGVGNWVADEVLWHARLHPEQLVSQLQPAHTKALHAALTSVVKTAVDVDADSARFPTGWLFHVRWGKKAGKLQGHPLHFITVGSRTSCFVPALQKLVGGGSAASARGKKSAGGGGGASASKKQKTQAADGGSSGSDTAASGDGDAAALVSEDEAADEAAAPVPSRSARKQAAAATRKQPAAAATRKQPAAAATREQPAAATRKQPARGSRK